MTRILCVTIQYPPHHLGGYEIACRDTMVRLAARGHDVTVLTGDARLPGVEDPAGERDGAPSGVKVRRDLRLYLRGTALWSPPPWVRLAVERTNQAALCSALTESRPEVGSIWHLGGGSMGLLTSLLREDIALVYGIGDDWLSYGPVVDAWSRLFLDHPRCGRLAERLLGVPCMLPDIGANGSFCFVSDVTRRRSEALSTWTFPDSAIVPVGVDRSLFSPASGRTYEAWSGRLLYVGRYDARKGIETLLAALPALPGAVLTVLGTGDEAYRQHLNAMVAARGIADRVTFSSAHGPALVQHYRDADALVFPSEWEEPFGLVPVEAMACGTPVVATGVGGSGEFLSDGRNCVLFRPGDPAALAGAVGRLAGSAQLRTALVQGGLATAADLDVEHLADAFEAWHEAAAHRFPAGRPATRVVTTARPAVVPAGHTPRSASPVCTRLAEVVASRSGPILDLADQSAGAVAEHLVPRSDVITVATRRPFLNPPSRAPGRTVVAAVEQLPFRTAAFGAVACQEQFERVRHDRAAADEIARVARPDAMVAIAVPNRRDLGLYRRRWHDHLHGAQRPLRSYLLVAERRRAYTRGGLERITRPTMQSVAWVGVGRPSHDRRGPLGRAVDFLWRRWPLDRLAPDLVLVSQRR